MRGPIKENPVTSMLMAGFGIFIFAAYMLVVQPEKAEQRSIARNMCGEPVTLTEETASNTQRSNNSIYERTILDN